MHRKRQEFSSVFTDFLGFPIWIGESKMGIGRENNAAPRMLMHGRLFVRTILDAHDTHLFAFQFNFVVF